MSTTLKANQLCEIKRILHDGEYLRQGTIRSTIGHVGLAFSKYILYTGVKSWRQNAAKPFNDCPLSKGQRTKAMSFLVKRGVLIYDNNRRARAKNFIKKIEELEKEIYPVKGDEKNNDGIKTQNHHGNNGTQKHPGRYLE